MKFRIRYLFLGIVIISTWMVRQILNLPTTAEREWSDAFWPMVAAMFSQVASPILAILFFRQGSEDFQEVRLRGSAAAFLCGMLSMIAFLLLWFWLPQLGGFD